MMGDLDCPCGVCFGRVQFEGMLCPLLLCRPCCQVTVAHTLNVYLKLWSSSTMQYTWKQCSSAASGKQAGNIVLDLVVSLQHITTAG